MSIIPARAIDDKRLSPECLRVLATIGTYSNRDGWCFPSQTTIGNRLGVTRSAINMQIKHLVKCGYIEKQERYKDNAQISSLYRIIFDATLQKEFYREFDEPSETEPIETEDGVSIGLTPPVNVGLTPPVNTMLTQNVPINVPINESENEFSHVPESHKKGDIIDGMLAYQKIAKTQIERYPTDVQVVIQEFSRLWELEIPGDKINMRKWIGSAHNLINAYPVLSGSNETITAVLEETREMYGRRQPFGISHPYAINSLIAEAVGKITRRREVEQAFNDAAEAFAPVGVKCPDELARK
jgi:biotin operon repressor